MNGFVHIDVDVDIDVDIVDILNRYTKHRILILIIDAIGDRVAVVSCVSMIKEM